MSISKNNVKLTDVEGDAYFKGITCICGSVRLKAQVAEDEDNSWILLSCKKCNKTLYYNGA